METYIGPKVAPTFADPFAYDLHSSYEPMTIVEYGDDWYISKQTVPDMVDPTMDQFWQQIPEGKQGPQGPKGDSAPIPAVTANATTGEPGTEAEASVTQSIDGTRMNFNFTIPRGDQGEQGPAGEQGPEGPQGEPGEPGSDVDIQFTNNVVRRFEQRLDAAGWYYTFIVKENESKNACQITTRINYGFTNYSDANWPTGAVQQQSFTFTADSSATWSLPNELVCNLYAGPKPSSGNYPDTVTNLYSVIFYISKSGNTYTVKVATVKQFAGDTESNLAPKDVTNLHYRFGSTSLEA